MHIKATDTPFDNLRAQVLSLFGKEYNQIKLVVSPSEQKKEIGCLKETLGSERFFFVVDLLNLEIREIHGMQRWLGYSEKEFSLKQYLDEVIYPGQRLSLSLVASHVFNDYCKGIYSLKFMVQRFASRLTLRHYNGRYLLTKRTASVFQYDTKNRLTAYLNEFTIIGDYDGEPLEPKLHTSYSERETDKERDIMQKVCDSFQEMKIFGVRELQIARKIAYNPQITRAQISEDLNISITTIETYYRRFLTKARDLFLEDFPSVFAAATYLKKEGLL